MIHPLNSSRRKTGPVAATARQESAFLLCGRTRPMARRPRQDAEFADARLKIFPTPKGKERHILPFGPRRIATGFHILSLLRFPDAPQGKSSLRAIAVKGKFFAASRPVSFCSGKFFSGVPGHYRFATLHRDWPEVAELWQPPETIFRRVRTVRLQNRPTSALLRQPA